MPIVIRETQGSKNKTKQKKGGGGMDIGKADVALLSRALNVARGMVSPSAAKKAKGGKIKK